MGRHKKKRKYTVDIKEPKVEVVIDKPEIKVDVKEPKVEVVIDKPDEPFFDEAYYDMLVGLPETTDEFYHEINQKGPQVYYTTTTKTFYKMFFEEQPELGPRLFIYNEKREYFEYIIGTILIPRLVVIIKERIESFSRGKHGKLEEYDIDNLKTVLTLIDKYVKLPKDAYTLALKTKWDILPAKEAVLKGRDELSTFFIQSTRMKNDANTAKLLMNYLRTIDIDNTTLFVYSPTAKVEDVWLNGLTEEQLKHNVNLIANDFRNEKNKLETKPYYKHVFNDVLISLQTNSRHLDDDTRVGKLMLNHISTHLITTVAINKQNKRG